ncbi:MYND-type domain-containing protein [Mycena sanguinolenta]|uniref:phytol kinase n=1 Tax=Mycena sanguinolenta TaxID=230812 RepID=A0A8H7DEI7_9AGAR|nr:MYND-type domain-containing protein [Mycena sanguinolenta]
MYRYLSLERLSLFPISIRRFAIPAANGSADDFERLLDLVVNDPHRCTQCLPVLYANLDPIRIPDDENLHTDAVKCAGFALEALNNFEHAPKSTWPDLWPRIWAWIVFFEAHRECLVDPFARPFTCFELLGFLLASNRHAPTKADVSRTVGVRRLVMVAWFAVISDSEKPQEHLAFPDLCTVIRDMSFDTPQDFEEVLDGVDGAYNLGYVVVQSIKRLLATERPYLSDQNLVLLTDILSFLQNLGNDKIVSPALMENGGELIITVAAMACYDTDYGDRSAAQQKAVLLSLNALSPMLSCHRAMRTALASGLLQAILYCATISPSARDPSETQGLRQILSWTLPGSTVFQTVLEELETRLPSVKPLSDSPDFQRCWMHDDWLRFMTFADDRIAFMKFIQSEYYVLSKACDNMECGVIRTKADFKRCSRCQQVYYCCSDCQKLDWKVGGHREACHSIRTFASKNKDIGTQNLHFMRELFHRDLTEHRYSKSSVIPSNPFVSVMDYSFQGTPSLWLEGISWMQEVHPSQHVHWEEYLSRMSRSHGQMELHLMIVPEGFMFQERWAPPTRHLMFPQRSECPALHNSVRRLVQVDGRNVQEADIQQLLTANDNVHKIH